MARVELGGTQVSIPKGAGDLDGVLESDAALQYPKGAHSGEHVRQAMGLELVKTIRRSHGQKGAQR